MMVAFFHYRELLMTGTMTSMTHDTEWQCGEGFVMTLMNTDEDLVMTQIRILK